MVNRHPRGPSNTRRGRGSPPNPERVVSTSKVRVHISWGPKGRVIFDLTSEQLSTLQKAAKGGRGNVYRAFQRLDLERYYQALGDDGRDELVALLSRG